MKVFMAFLRIFMLFLAFFIPLSLFVLIIKLPAIIAKRKNITGNKLEIISKLCWFSLITGGVTWIIALILIPVYKPKK